jgi:hypothetical protein
MKALVLAQLVLALAVALPLALAGCGSDDSNEAASTQPVTVTETVTETVTAPPEAEALCSTAGLRMTLPEQDLPPVVADVRKRVFDAAVACDYDTLEQIALELGEGFTFSYGSETDASEYWRSVENDAAAEPKPMRTLATILTMQYTRNESGSYAWPTAYQESPSEADWELLVVSGLYTQEQIDSMKAAGSFLGYRTAITADGDWQFFVAGD